MRRKTKMQKDQRPSTLLSAGMLSIFLFFIVSYLLIPSVAAQQAVLIEISGNVVDQEKREPLSDVSVQIKGTVAGTTTNNSGYFTLRTRSKLPFTLVFTSIGFQQQEFEVNSMDS